MGSLITDKTWRLELKPEEAVNNSDKTFTVPTHYEWQVLWVWVELASSADAGTRQLELQVLDSADDVILRVVAGATQAASLTYHYLFAPGAVNLTIFRDTSYLSSSMPPLFLKEGYKLRVFDNGAIAAAADDMVVQLQIASRGS